jgi:hypothetical protein
MRRVLSAVTLVAIASATTGCYVARIETGLKPSAQVIAKDWAPCWIYGLVPPPTMQMATNCPNGVAIVETQHSFLNQLVGGLTFGLFTPIQIRVTCAEKPVAALPESPADIVLQASAPDRDIRAAFNDAARLAVKTGRGIRVQLTVE